MNQFNHYLKKVSEFGVVDKVIHPLVSVSGLPYAKPQEVVIFETGETGEIFSIDRDSIQILVFSRQPIEAGIKVTRTNQPLSVAVGEELLGQIIDPLGEPLDETTEFKTPAQTRQLESTPVNIAGRARIKKPLITGVAVVDMMLPLGKGQRELVIGDRKSGKTAFLLSVAKNQILLEKSSKQGSIVIYAAIAQKKTGIKKVQEFFATEGLLKQTVIIGTSPYDAPSLIYLTPYTAMTIAEHFRDLGKDVLVLLDDLSNHAKFYREISLLARRFPGRDSYPGDIFYLHARLLERAGNFRHQEGEANITCLPVVETVEGDLTGYISTNIMGMTDGHIFFDANIYYQGRKPAVNIPLSVTRVGKQTQNALQREVNQRITIFLTKYEKMKTLSHFGAELTPDTKITLQVGDKLLELFNQLHTETVPQTVQLVLFALIWLGFNLKMSVEQSRSRLIASYESKKNLLDSLVTAKSMSELLYKVKQSADQIFKLCLEKSK